MENSLNRSRVVQSQGLYDSRFEHDSCGVGFVCNVKGSKSHEIVAQGLEILRRLAHRGATGADPKTGDGAGVLIQIPHEFLLEKCLKEKIKLPPAGEYAAGLVFLPANTRERKLCKDILAKFIRQEGQELLGWRKVPVDDSDIGETAKLTQPSIEQVFIKAVGTAGDTLNFERKLYLIRRQAEKAVSISGLKNGSVFYITNLSSRTLSYKGLLMPGQLEAYFPDLREQSLKSAICLAHSRYSTNTFPTWNLAQPFRFLAHNGEINTLRGNINWMRAREGLLKSKLFGKDVKKLIPVIVPGGSDSAALDNVLELLILGGRPLAQAMMMLVPLAWEHAHDMSDKLRSFYKFHSCFMEPWDGPAAIAFTDGVRVGAMLDRNGLRPCRYLLTKDDRVIMASEVGVLDLPPENIRFSGRLEPGKFLFINTEAGRIIEDLELKEIISGKHPYPSWLSENMSNLADLPSVRAPKKEKFDLLTHLRAFGYTREDLKVIIKPMVESAQEPVGAMGNDTPHAVLSRKPQMIYSYFKQLFAQVTNPPIDPIREELVMSLATYLGPEKNILEETSVHCNKLFIENPVLSDEGLAKIQGIKLRPFRSKTISLLFSADEEKDFSVRLDKICLEAASAIKEGYTFIILSDRGVDQKHAALPALLACAAAHHFLVKKSLRAQLGIIVESAEPREVHHFALLFGYGADCINPYLAFEAVKLVIEEEKSKINVEEGIHNYIKAVNKGIKKILSKMGISTLQSYRGAQIFEALGLGKSVIDRYFTGTVSRIGGAELDIIARETLLRHQEAFEARADFNILSTGGLYQWKKDGEFHLWNPESICALQEAARKNNPQKYREFSRLINDQSQNPATLRGLFKIKKAKNPVALESVESVERIFQRFCTGAMSFGSISGQAHRAMALAMNRLKGKSNTGEGGEDPARFVKLANGDSFRSAIKQVASGRFGVTANYLVNADELQIKISQGAKPGEGGQLPGHKVSAIIAKTRYTTPGVTLISPPPHHDIYSIEDLAQLIFDLKNVNPKARISVKLVSEIGVGTVAAGVAKGHADMILISGGDGGTGASPWSSIKHAGLPWELGLSETQQTLVLNDLRSRVRLQTDGQMRTGRDVAVAALLGAEEYGFASAVLVTLGCVMLRHCNLNNCSLGVATQDELLEHRFSGKPEYIINYFNFVAEELRLIMAELGLRTVDEMIGKTEFLEMDKGILPWKAKGLDFSGIFYKASVGKDKQTRNIIVQEHGLEHVLDRELITLCKPVFNPVRDYRATGIKQDVSNGVKIELPIKNSNRSVGAMLSGEICANFGEAGLNEDTIYCKFKGYAGQSFGAFLAQGVTFELEGMANDYVGKGISGGKIIIYPDKKVTYDSQENIIAGNTLFYGAISGEAYIRGRAGERFAIRNSGLYAVVEGVGDHCCEYMTGGRVVVLGRTGRNFAAGMSGGIAYVYNYEGKFKDCCNLEMVGLERLDKEDIVLVKKLVSNHFRYTQSLFAKKLLDNFAAESGNFVKVMPFEYKKILEQKKVEKDLSLAQELEG